jgi:hypothetical protein
MRAYHAIACLIWFPVLALAGCGGGARATPVPPPSPAPAPTATGVTPRAQDCGTIEIRANQVTDAPAARQATDCFWQAYQQCATVGRATLAEAVTGIDTVTRRIFTADGAGGTCHLREDIEFRVVPAAPSARTNMCTGVTRSADGRLQFLACGDDANPIVPSVP